MGFKSLPSLCSKSFTSLTQVVVGLILSLGFSLDWLVVEPGLRGSNAVLLSHLEVLTEVLVTTPPIEMDHAKSLVSPDLMDVGISEIVLDAIDWESSISVAHGVELVGLTKSVSPMLNHSLLSHLLVQVEKERASQVESHKEVHNSESILSVEWLHLPVGVTNWVFVEARDVLEGSPFLAEVSWLVDFIDELSEVTLSMLGQGTNKGNDRIRNHIHQCTRLTYRPIMSARSFRLGTPYMNPSIPVPRSLRFDFGLSRSYRYSVIFPTKSNYYNN